MTERDRWNASRFDPSDSGGLYESYFQRANHPQRKLGFWIRYTIFAPRGRPERAVGEKWAIYFDGERGPVTAVKEVLPFDRCSFSRSALAARIGDAELSRDALDGAAASGGHRIGWSLRYTSPQEPLLLFPRALYTGPFPKARALVGSPNAVYSGTLTVDGEQVDVDGWVGSQNHNWGSKHTDDYAWAQVAGFDDAPDGFLECGAGRTRLGPVWTPRFTLAVLRLDGRELCFNQMPVTAMRARSRFDFFTFDFETSTREARLSGQVSAAPRCFVGLPYDNPPGGRKTCINTKIARCQLTVRLPGRAPRTLISENRAAFEILTDERDHGVPMLNVDRGE